VSDSALSLAIQLNQVLSLEFDALKGQDLDRFEALQASKNAILADLTLLCPDTEDLQKLPEWDQLREELLECRDSHRRNAVLIERKLDAIFGSWAQFSFIRG
jgi:flagellar biosynthesis/type III secretory pathway chaperone